MSKPCSKLPKPNPFETYRDPVTGRWEVKYPASHQPDFSDIASTATLELEYLNLNRLFLAGAFPPPRRRWKSKPRTKVMT